MQLARKLVLLCSLAALPAASQAVELMPSFAVAPTGWTTDRYDPAAFGNVGTVQGRSDVLGISISTADGLGNRASGFNSTFYNTQGMGTAVSGGAGSTLSADLFVDSNWATDAGGSVRTDMWGVASGGTDYLIVGFSNYGGLGRFRIWDANTVNGWVEGVASVNYGAWNALSITYTGSSFVYSINGTAVYTDSTVTGTQFTGAIMQAYNFNGDPSLTATVPGNYTAHWSNAQTASVPDAASTALLVGLGLLAMAGYRRRLAAK